MNIQIQCCGLVMMAFLFYFDLRHKKVGLYTEKIFTKTLLITMICVTLDILSVIAITYREKIPEMFLNIVCKSYIVSIIWVGYAGLVYVLTDLYEERKYYQIKRIYILIAAAASLLVYFLPIYYFRENKTIYTYGPSVSTTYLFAVFFVADSFYQMVKKRKLMNQKRRKAAMMWMVGWLIAAGIQFLDNRLLLVGFAMSLGMMILFLCLENPESNMDRQVGCFNSHVLLEYMKQCYNRKDKFGLLLISYAHYPNRAVEQEKVVREIRRMVPYLEKQHGIKVFKDVEQELVLFFHDKQELEKSLAYAKEIFFSQKQEENGQEILQPLLIVMPDSTIAASAEEVFQLFRYSKMENRNHTEETVIYIDENGVQENRKNEKIRNMIIEAISEDRVEVFYQPIYSVSEDRFISAEALVRIRNRDGNIVPPGQFIAVAEETGLIAQLGEKVFEKTCRFIKKKDIRKYGIEYIEVNLSVVQCEQRNLAKTYIQIMERYGVDPSCINLEVTETASIQTKKILMENMKTLISYGVAFSLDDFGNGQSNLDYLIDMPVSILKIDQNMTKAYFNTMKAKFVVEAAVNMVHEMNLTMVAEGIETKDQLLAMKKIGVDYIQGFYFSKPLSEEKFIEFLYGQQKVDDILSDLLEEN